MVSSLAIDLDLHLEPETTRHFRGPVQSPARTAYESALHTRVYYVSGEPSRSPSSWQTGAETHSGLGRNGSITVVQPFTPGYTGLY